MIIKPYPPSRVTTDAFYSGRVTGAAILSADLTSEVSSSMITQLKLIDAEDDLISILESTLRQWHYSELRTTWIHLPSIFL